jgi:hypothetical protein
MSDYHIATVQISTIWQGGDLFPAVILTDDDKYIEYILLGDRDVRGAWIDKPSIRHAPKGNDRGAYPRQDQGFRTAFHNSLQHAVNLLNGTEYHD